MHRQPRPAATFVDKIRMKQRCHYCAALSVSQLAELAEKEFESHFFPQHAYYEHHHSNADLEQSAEDGCDFCDLILDCLKTTPDEPHASSGKNSARVCEISDSIYSFAKQLERSDVRLCIISDHVYLNDPIPKVKVFDTLLIQIGHVNKVAANDDENDQLGLEPVSLIIRTNRRRC